MKVLYTLLCLCIFSLPGFSADCSVLEGKMFDTPYTPTNYQRNIQAVDSFYNNGCKRNFISGGQIDKNFQLANVALFTSENTADKLKYLQISYNYFLKSQTDNGQNASQVAIQIGKQYAIKNLQDNAIIWFKRAAEKQKQATGSTGYIPAYIADMYIIKGDCSSNTFDLYRQAITNLGATNNYSLMEEVTYKMQSAQRACHN